MAQNLGEQIAAAWEAAMAKVDLGRDTFLYDLFESGKVTTPLTTRQKKRRLKIINRREARYKRHNLKRLATFMGRIVKVEGDMYDPTLVYADGRRLRLTEYFWEKK